MGCKTINADRCPLAPPPGHPRTQHQQHAGTAVARPGSGLTGEQVIAYCRDNLAAYKVPARVDVVDELPKSATGKLLKRVLRERAAP